MKGLIKIMLAIFSMVLVHILLSKDVPEVLKDYNIPTSLEVTELIQSKVDEHLKNPTISISTEMVGSLFYIGNNEMIEDGFLLEDIETELTILKVGDFGIEANIKTIRPSNKNSKVDRESTTTRIDSSGKLPIVKSYDILHKKKVQCDNNWIVIDKGTSYAYLSIVNLLDGKHVKDLILELVFDKAENINPILSVKLLSTRLPTESDKVSFDFGKDRKFVYSNTKYKAIRVGIN